MENLDTTEFFKWLEKTKSTEHDIINCRKMQSLSIAESENAFGINKVSVCGFIHNDVVQLGGEIVQRYDEDKAQFIDRAFKIFMVSAALMDSVNGILCDEGAWGADYFTRRLTEWRDKKLTEIN